MQNKTIESMAPETKHWFAKAIVGMILADGKIAKEELDYLNNLISFLSEPNIVEDASKMLKNNEVPSLDPLDISTNEALEIVKHLTIIAVVDEALANREVRYLKFVADQLGLSPDIPERFLALAKEKLKRAKLTARVTTNDVSEQVRCFDVSEEGCMFYSHRRIQANVHLTLQFYNDSSNSAETGLFQPIDAESSWSTAVKSKHGNFVVGIVFENPLTEQQGLGLIKHIQTGNK